MSETSPVFVETTSAKLYDRMDPESLHPERTAALDQLKELENRNVITITKLGSLFNIEKTRTNTPGTFPCIEMEDVEIDFGLIASERRISISEAGTSNVACKGGQILFSGIRPYLNKVTFIPSDIKKAICSGEFYVLIPRKPKLPLGIIWLLLRSELVLNQSSHLIGGALRPRIDDDAIADLDIPMPTDTKLVSNFNQMALKAVAQYSHGIRMLEKAETSFLTAIGLEAVPEIPRLFFAIATHQPDSPRPYYRMDPLFFHPSYYRNLKSSLEKWAERKKGAIEKLEKLCVPNGISRPKAHMANDKGTTARLGVENVTGKGILWHCSHVEVALYQSKAFLRKHDLLISATGIGSTGRVEIYVENNNPTVTDGHIAVVRLKPNSKPYYVLAYLRTEYGRRQLKRMERGTSGQIELYADDIGNMLVPIPKTAYTSNKAQSVLKKSLEAMEAAKFKLSKARRELDSILLVN